VEIWDYVLREYVDPDLMTTAHITPFLSVFQTSHRPKARYLYFRYVVALLRARRHKRKGWLQ